MRRVADIAEKQGLRYTADSDSFIVFFQPSAVEHHGNSTPYVMSIDGVKWGLGFSSERRKNTPVVQFPEITAVRWLKMLPKAMIKFGFPQPVADSVVRFFKAVA